MDKINIILSVLGLSTPFLIYWITVKANQEKKMKEDFETLKSEVVDIKLDIVRLESNKVSKEHLDKLMLEITTKIDSTNEKLNRLLGHIERGCKIE